jgi:uncharacterized membrane protein
MFLMQKKIIDNRYYEFDFKGINIDKWSTYKFEILPINATIGNAITIYKTKDKNVVYKLTEVSPCYTFCILILIAFIIVNLIFNYLINNNLIKNEKRFLLLLLIYFIPITFIIPAFQVPDEVYHFYRAYNLSTYNFSKLPGKNLSNTSYYLPTNINCLRYSKSSNIDDNSINIINSNFVSKCIKSTKNKKIVTNVSGNNSVFSYVIPAIAIKIADTLTNSPMIIFFSGRFANLLFAMLIILLSFKIVPITKKYYLLLLSMPVFVQQMCSYSYDSIVNALSCLLIAYLLKFIFSSEKIKTRDFIVYGIITFILCEIKLPYAFLSLLIFIVDKKKFGDVNQKKYKILKILLLILVSFSSYLIMTKINQYAFVSNSSMQATNLFSRQFSYIISHPLNVFTIIFNTFKKYGIWYFDSMVGILGWLNVNIDHKFIIAFFIVLILSIFSEESVLSKKQKIFLLILIIIILTGIFAVTYLGWSKYKLNYVDGVQGRYFIPLLIPFILLLLPKKQKIIIKNEFIYSFVIIMLFVYIATLCIAYY